MLRTQRRHRNGENVMKCAACGSAALVEGELTSTDGQIAKFSPTGDSKLFRILGIGQRPVRAYGCTRCSHLQLAVEFSDKDRERYQNFEGEQQRSIVETISEE